MRSDTILACVAFGAVAVFASGCSQAPPPAFTDGTGEAANAPQAYPAGPFGVLPGTVISNLEFIGYANAQAYTTTMQPVALGDFYNPHGLDKTYQPAPGADDDRLFAAGSQYGAGKPKPTVLLIDVACVWCAPCNDEAKNILPALHAMYKTCGGEFLLNLHDSGTRQVPATPQNLHNWTYQYKVDYPSSIDPSFKMDELFVQEAFPQNFIIDTTTMTIVKVIPGAEPRLYCSDTGTQCATNADCSASGATCAKSTFWSAYESHLDTSRAGCTLK